MQLPQLPQDKANHAMYGAAIFLVAGAIAAMSCNAQHARFMGFCAALLFGCAKELADWLLNRRAALDGYPAHHGVEGGDILATVGGAALCWIAAVVTDY